MFRKLITCITILTTTLASNTLQAKHKYPESYYQKKDCQKRGGIIEYKRHLGRIDCLTNNLYAQDFKVKYLYNYDGDTITVDFDCDIEYFCKNVKIRLYGVDTPEIRTLDKCEKERGQKAKEFVSNKLLNANKIIARHCLKGKYHREICKIIFDGKDLSNELLESELAVPYYGEKKQFINWCK